MKTLEMGKFKNQDHMPYAIKADFCRIFEENMSSLYLLSLLLTGNRAMAEKCFVRGLEDSGSSNLVFREWAESWARRTIIQNAIQMVQPSHLVRASNPIAEPEANDSLRNSEGVAEIIALPAFERFVYVMSVLERYSDQDCALLLRCTRNDIIEARAHAFEQIAASAEQSHNLVSATETTRPSNDKSVLPLAPMVHLAASA